MGLLGPKNPKNEFPAESDDIDDSIYGRFGRKIIFLDSLDPGDPFCTLDHLHNSFCDDFEVL